MIGIVVTIGIISLCISLKDTHFIIVNTINILHYFCGMLHLLCLYFHYPFGKTLYKCVCKYAINLMDKRFGNDGKIDWKSVSMTNAKSKSYGCNLDYVCSNATINMSPKPTIDNKDNMKDGNDTSNTTPNKEPTITQIGFEVVTNDDHDKARDSKSTTNKSLTT